MYSIGEVVNKLNINKETIRYYEKIGLLKDTKRDSNGYRMYKDDDIEILQFILMAKEYDFTLKEIGILLSKMFPDINGLNQSEIGEIVDNKIGEINKKIEELTLIRNVLDKVKSNVLTNKKNCYIGKSIDEILNN